MSDIPTFSLDPWVYGLGLTASIIAVGSALSAVIKRARTARKPLLLYVSWGGTCRDPMAKVLTERHLGDRARWIRVLSAGARIPQVANPLKIFGLLDVGGHTHTDRRRRASLYAVQRIHEEFGSDALGRYRIRRISRRLLENARLIILFGPEFYKDIRSVCPAAERKAVVFHEYFACSPIPNPWREGQRPGSDEARSRYKETYDALNIVLSSPSNLEKLFRDLTQ